MRRDVNEADRSAGHPMKQMTDRTKLSLLVIPYGFTYWGRMADVVIMGEARDALHQIARRFDAATGEPVFFGSHRRAQGVIVRVDVWEKLLDQAEDELDLDLARRRLAVDHEDRLTIADPDEAFRQAGEAATRNPA